MNSICVSIIIPVYNVEPYLARCLDSVFAQTFKDFEVIAVNDGSTDKSADILNQYALTHSNMLVINKENGGLSSARNIGIAHCNGEYISFIDSDDFVEDKMIETLYNAAKAENADIALSAYNRYNEITKKIKPVELKVDKPFNKPMADDYSVLRLAPYAWNKLFRTEFLKKSKILFPDGYIYEDIATVYPLMKKANKITVIDIPLYNYCINRGGSIMTDGQRLDDMFHSLKICNDFFRNDGIDEIGEQYLCYLNLKHIYNRFKEIKNSDDVKTAFWYIDKAFEFLNKNFNDWRNNIYFKNYSFKKRILNKTTIGWKYVIIKKRIKNRKTSKN